MEGISRLKLGKIKKIFELYPQIKLVYFFGSKATGKGGPLSDYDFAVYADEKDPKKIFEIKIDLIVGLNRILKTDKIDLVILNTAFPEMKYNIIKEGKILLEKEPYKILVEPKILNEYFDFRHMLLRNNLIKSL